MTLACEMAGTPRHHSNRHNSIKTYNHPLLLHKALYERHAPIMQLLWHVTQQMQVPHELFVEGVHDGGLGGGVWVCVCVGGCVCVCR